MRTSLRLALMTILASLLAVEKSIVRNNGLLGVDVVGNGNVVSGVQVLENFRGDNNTARSNNARDNGLYGVACSGSNVLIANNTVLRNGQCGVSV